MSSRYYRMWAIQNKISLLQEMRADYIKTEPEDEEDKKYLQHSIEYITRQINESKELLYKHIARAYLNNQL